MKISELKFLVVDDMKTMRVMAKQNLKSMGAVHIDEAEDGAIAWELATKAKSFPYQFIVCDWNMPNMTGGELLKKCRQDDAYSNVAFLMLTAENEMHIVKEAIASGVDSYLVKPFAPTDFQARIEQVFKKRFGDLEKQTA